MRYTPAATYNEPVFTPEECASLIESHADSFKPVGIRTGKNEKVRKASAVPLSISEDQHIYQQTIPLVLEVNNQIWEYDITGHESLQLLQYTVGGHYEWHLDMGADQHMLRKLSFIIALTDPAEYEGGEVLFKASSQEQTFKLTQGQLVIFPSFILHKVNPVTSGKRHVLVGWLSGDRPFR